MSQVTLQHANVNGGTAVTLYGASVKFSWKNLTKPNPIPGKYDISETEYGGFENPKIVITGAFSVDDIDSNELTQELLTDFAALRSTTPITLTVSTGSTPTYLKGRPSGGYETDGDMTLSNSIKIQIESFDISISGQDSDLGHFWNYSITAHETI